MRLSTTRFHVPFLTAVLVLGGIAARADDFEWVELDARIPNRSNETWTLVQPGKQARGFIQLGFQVVPQPVPGQVTRVAPGSLNLESGKTLVFYARLKKDRGEFIDHVNSTYEVFRIGTQDGALQYQFKVHFDHQGGSGFTPLDGGWSAAEKKAVSDNYKVITLRNRDGSEIEHKGGDEKKGPPGGAPVD